MKDPSVQYMYRIKSRRRRDGHVAAASASIGYSRRMKTLSWVALLLLVQLLGLIPATVYGDPLSSDHSANGNYNRRSSSVLIPPPPPPPPSHQPTTTTTEDQIQIVETEYWNGERWMAAPQNRWTTQDGQASMSPADVQQPPDGVFDGAWKIMLGDATDDYGWTYLYHHDYSSISHQFPKRQRIWLRTVLRQPQQPPQQQYTKQRFWKSPVWSRTRRPTPLSLPRIQPYHQLLLPQLETALRQVPTTCLHVQSLLHTALRNMQDDWNFKGFGFSFYKSFLFKTSFGLAFRVPLTTNFDVWERHPEWPRLTMSVGFYYPFTMTLNVGGSVNVEYLKWIALQALLTARHVIAVTLLLLARGFVLAGSALAFPMTRQWHELPEPHLLLPKLRDTLARPVKPNFSGTLQERVGVSYSWRLSAKRGYETRRTCWHLYLPTLLSVLQHLDRIQQSIQIFVWQRRLEPHWNKYGRDYYHSSSRYLAGFVPAAIKKRKRSTATKQQKKKKKKTLPQEQQATTDEFRPVSLFDESAPWAEWWLQRHTGCLGVSTGGPIPYPPHFSCSAVLSLSGFYFSPDTIRGSNNNNLPIVVEEDEEESTKEEVSEASDVDEEEASRVPPPPPLPQKVQANATQSLQIASTASSSKSSSRKTTSSA
ncbi:expressed unknown protein [Seminavis robusta]|uniref:Uncharacterized protein n=1 Tax=Seminavis robusta TaxID=568900 RepID=A0A9N8DY98_9STRA|nr:expressed unknown protein [Seminavis robusta]|eukprot:Sro441_g143750.1 n/a (649) ;mRNA; r:54657-56603